MTGGAMGKVLGMKLTGGRNQRVMASLVHYPDWLRDPWSEILPLFF